MGSCVCKEQNEDPSNGQTNHSNTRASLTGSQPNSTHNDAFVRSVYGVEGCPNMKTLSDTVDKLVNETLEVIGTIVDNEPDPPSSILMLHMITDKPTGWIELVRSLMRVVPVEHPMGPSVIALLLDDSPLPTRESVLKVADMITNTLRRNPRKERNLCVILGCLAEKLAGPSSIALLNKCTLRYLCENLLEDVDGNVKLLSLIALEKFAQTSENKATIKRALATLQPNPLENMEKFADNNENYLKRQIGFCARWCLDNYFAIEGRQYAYETTDVSKINAMLNIKDVSEYLKISPDGLEARCDAYTFESVRCTFQATNGCWYYEVLLITPGVMQIGWATKESNFLNDDGYGIGDDKYSIGFDGCRKLIWHNAKSIPHNLPTWRSGSILGCLLDLDKHEVIFSLDGQQTDAYRHIFSNAKSGFFAAASFMSFQQCRFNFGLTPFSYAPDCAFRCFNDEGNLQIEDKIVLPRHIFLDMLRKVSIRDDSCTLCFDRRAEIRLEPCNHNGFCAICVQQLQFCPMCRVEISGKCQVISLENSTANTPEVEQLEQEDYTNMTASLNSITGNGNVSNAVVTSLPT